jgi:hypothetical protein
MAVGSWFKHKSRGSLIPLSFGFFLIAMTLSFISINISAAYAAKKELTNIGEAAINSSAHSINLLFYYGEINRFDSMKRVPLNCQEASSKFYTLISQSRVSDKVINVDSFNCDLYEVSAQISITAQLPIDIPFFHLNELDKLKITTSIGASSEYIPN